MYFSIKIVNGGYYYTAVYLHFVHVFACLFVFGRENVQVIQHYERSLAPDSVVKTDDMQPFNV